MQVTQHTEDTGVIGEEKWVGVSNENAFIPSGIGPVNDLAILKGGISVCV